MVEPIASRLSVERFAHIEPMQEDSRRTQDMLPSAKNMRTRVRSEQQSSKIKEQARQETVSDICFRPRSY